MKRNFSNVTALRVSYTNFSRRTR